GAGQLWRDQATLRRMGGAQRYPSIAVGKEDGFRCALPILQSNYFILVSAAISSLPSAVVIVSRTCSPLPPAGIVAEMRFPLFGSAFTVSLNNIASPRFNVTRNGVAGSILKN